MKKIKQLMLLVALTISFFFLSFEATATHLMGGQITYTYVSGNTYLVTLTIYRDCDGVGLPSSAFLGITGQSSVSLPRIVVNDVTILCPGQSSTCNGGAVPGIEEHIYQGNITLNTPGVYDLSYSDCCRNSVITTGSADQGFYLSAQINTLLAPGNSSPNFLNAPIGKYCTGSAVSVGPNGSDADGDVIIYSLVAARQSATQSVSYNAPFSATSPLTSSTGTSINPNTGEISFTPTANEIPVLAFKAEEYRVINGNSTKIGEVIREIQLELSSCAGNSPPVLSAVPNAIVQVGQNYCVNINATDAATQTISLSAVASIIPPATFNVTNSGLGFTNSTFCFTPQASDAGNTYTVSVNAQDDNCPSSATAVRTWNITVPAACNVSLTTSSTGESCAGNDGTATANMVGGTAPYAYSWTGPNGYTSFAGPTITGLEAGTYNVNISDANQCASSASVIVDDDCGSQNNCPITNSFGPIWINSHYKAAGASDPYTYYWGLSYGVIVAKPTGGTAPYTYNWYSGAGYTIKNPTSRRPRLWYPTGPQWVYVDITDATNCTITDSVYIDWVDFTCNQPLIWWYELCDINTNTTICVPTTVGMRNLVMTGNYTYGPCNTVPKTDLLENGNNLEMGVNVFPNPNNGAFTISISNTSSKVYDLKVLDMNGRVLFVDELNPTDKYATKELHLDGLAAGMYMLHVSDGNQHAVERIIIQ